MVVRTISPPTIVRTTMLFMNKITNQRRMKNKKKNPYLYLKHQNHGNQTGTHR